MHPAPLHRSAPDAIAVLILLAVATVALATFRDYGLGWDDFTHAQMGDLLLAFYASGFEDRRALSFVNLYMYGGGFDMAAALLAKALPFELFETRRLLGALVGLVGLVATWRTARRIGGPLAGLIALVLLATCPLYYGHMFFNPKDAPFAVAMAVLLCTLVRAFDEYPRPSVICVLLVGLGFGLAVGTRVMGVLGALYAAAALALLIAIEARALGFAGASARSGRFMLRLAPAALLAYAVTGMLWPWAVLEPLNPLRALTYFSTFFEKPWRELFGGAQILVPDMPWSYLPTLLALKLPEIFTLLASGGVVLAAFCVAKPGLPPNRRAALLLVLCAALVPVLITLVTRPALYNGIRHFLFILPPLALLGGFAGSWMLQWLAQRSRIAAAAGAVVIGAGCAIPVADMVRLHPYEYTHFNRISGGVQAADGRYMLDYWGLSFKQGGEALRAALAARNETPPAGRRWKIAVCGPHPPAEVALGPDFEATWSPQGADFALMLGAFYCARLDAPVLAEVTRAGVVYARAYDLRGRSFETLFTLPPVER